MSLSTVNRRTFLLGLGTAAGASGVVMGSGAFTSVEANRDVSVRVAADANAFLALRPVGPNAAYTETTDGTLGIDLTGENPTAAGGQGVNPDSITVFEDMFEVRNQGTREIEVEITPPLSAETDAQSVLSVLTVPETDFPSVGLAPGETERYSLIVDAFSGGRSSGLELDETITVTGGAV
jgi:hypothetical protein